MPSGEGHTITSLPELQSVLCQQAGFDELLSSLGDRKSVSFDGVWGSSRALLAATIAESQSRQESSGTSDSMSGPLLVVLPRMRDADEFAHEVTRFWTRSEDESPLIFPAWESLPQERDVSDAIFGGRLRVLSVLDSAANSTDECSVIVTSIAALLQPVPSKAERDSGTRVLNNGEDVDLDELIEWLRERGFERVPALRLPGEYAIRGSIVDIFPPDAVDPLRIEFFGEEIESLRRFDVESQRTIEKLDSVGITVLSPAGSDEESSVRSQTDVDPGAVREHFMQSMPPSASILLCELDEVVSEGKLYLSRLEQADIRDAGLFTVQSTLARFAEFGMATASGLAMERGSSNLRLPIQSMERIGGPKGEALQELLRSLDDGESVLLACHNEAEQERLAEMLVDLQDDFGEELTSRITLCGGFLSQGFRITLAAEAGSETTPRDRLIVISDHELFSRQHVRRAKRRSRVETRSIDNFLELKEGDYVVHLTQGIGRFKGMRLLEKNEKVEEHLIIEFRNGITVYVPASLIHLIQKYVGGGKTHPELSKLGGKAWEKKKEKVADAVADMASDMLQIQALREARQGYACPPDSEWQREFDAAFPYTETEDQLVAIGEAKSDLMRTQPMDRLICGDVGYGKTEVAMRAAFKMVDAGRQVAVLVPTTVLAEQHSRSFADRMAEFPVSIECLSRFKTKGEQRKILDRMAAGTVDIVIGTHRLVQKDIRFKNLGLLIIDEEQRFGVAHKEMLKHLRLEVDVLTMTATPIPRTLHLSLLGVRDISNLLTPPQDRQAVETRIATFDEDLIRRAIVRELNRGGQVYFVHNRVHNIQAIANLVRSVVPEARVMVGHGQMKEAELEEAMVSFVDGHVDVLVSTTIIESGLDIPNANTIIINNAGHFGLSELHQLRGRVGRDRHRAYCYLLIDPNQGMTSDAKRRLRAIEEYSELGAGFKIAMRDLEIRGAGNILGTQQSGHIASVGYELYCQLLENSVRQMKGLPVREHQHVTLDLSISGFIPNEYIPPGKQKIEMYRKLSLVNSQELLVDVTNEMEDRFGTPPVEVRRLLGRKELQLRAWAWGVEKIWLEDGYVVFQHRDPKKIGELVQIIGDDLRIVDARRVYYYLDDADAVQEAMLDQIMALLPEREAE